MKSLTLIQHRCKTQEHLASRNNFKLGFFMAKKMS